MVLKWKRQLGCEWELKSWAGKTERESGFARFFRWGGAHWGEVRLRLKAKSPNPLTSSTEYGLECFAEIKQGSKYYVRSGDSGSRGFVAFVKKTQEAALCRVR